MNNQKFRNFLSFLASFKKRGNKDLLIFLLFAFIPGHCYNQIVKDNKYEFINFYLNITCHSTVDSENYSFLVCNDCWHFKEDVSNNLDNYYPNVLYFSQHGHDTIKYSLNNSQIERIYNLGRELFILPTKLAYTSQKIYFTAPYDGITVDVVLDLCSRGPKFLIERKYPSAEVERLLKYLRDLKNIKK